MGKLPFPGFNVIIICMGINNHNTWAIYEVPMWHQSTIIYCKRWFYLILAADMRKSTGLFMNVSSRFIQHLVSVFTFSRSAYLSRLPNYKHSVFPISHIRFDIIQCIVHTLGHVGSKFHYK